MSEFKSWVLIGGPLDGQYMPVQGVQFVVKESPSWPPLIRPASTPEPIRSREGTYSTRAYLANAMQWDGWRE